LSLLAAAAGIIFAFIGIVKDGGPHLQGYHPLIGCIAFFCALITLLLGILQFRTRNKAALRTAHRLSGQLSMGMFLIATVLGFKLIHLI